MSSISRLISLYPLVCPHNTHTACVCFVYILCSNCPQFPCITPYLTSYQAQEVRVAEAPQVKEPVDIPETKPVPAKPAAVPDKPVVKPAKATPSQLKPAAIVKPSRSTARGASPGRTTYTRDFLLAFKPLEVCRIAPPDLVKHDCYRSQ